jgi:hypothetical protein
MSSNEEYIPILTLQAFLSLYIGKNWDDILKPLLKHRFGSAVTFHPIKGRPDIISVSLNGNFVPWNTKYKIPQPIIPMCIACDGKGCLDCLILDGVCSKCGFKYESVSFCEDCRKMYCFTCRRYSEHHYEC